MATKKFKVVFKEQGRKESFTYYVGNETTTRNKVISHFGLDVDPTIEYYRVYEVEE